MEQEVVRFDTDRLPLKLHRLCMHKDGVYRGVHAHAAIEIVEVMRGELSCCINDTAVCLQPGQTLFINGNTGHQLCPSEAEVRYLHVDIGFLKDSENEELPHIYAFLLRNRAKPYMLIDGDEEIAQLLQKIGARCEDTSEARRWYLKGYAYELAAFMYAQAFVTPPAMSEKHRERIEPIVRYIDANFKRPLTLGDVCSAVIYNKYTVCHAFKEATGATVFEYINFLRVHAAVDQLKQKHPSLLTVAAENGFASASYFNRVFKEVMGCSPSVYRKLLTK